MWDDNSTKAPNDSIQPINSINLRNFQLTQPIHLNQLIIMLRNRIFYTIKPLIPRSLQIFIRRQVAKRKREAFSHIWPIDPATTTPPKGWSGWPEGKKFAVVLSHDVDTQNGLYSVHKLMEIEMEKGMRSSFNFVPERYWVSEPFITNLEHNGFQVCVHGLKHDGKLFLNKKKFSQRAEQINYYIKKWNAKGFTAPSMLCKSEWLHALNIVHSTSTFDTDPFEPQPQAAGTVFPFWVQNGNKCSGYLELPYTLPQDHLLFIILREKSINIWKKKLDWIAQYGGMALLNTHTDYMSINGNRSKSETYPVEYYIEFLDYIKTKYAGQYYHALPSEITRFWRSTLH